jgi:hypothetical protein
MKRNYAQSKLKQFRFDKRRPRRVRHTTEIDLGNKLLVRQETSPIVETKEVMYDKTKSGNYHDLYNRNGLLIRKSLKTQRIYAYHMVDKVGTYICELENHDLWALGIVCLRAVEAFTEIIQKTVKGINYVRYVLSLKKAPKDLFGGSISVEIRPNLSSKR